MKGCFGALKPAPPNYIAKLSTVQVAQCGECLFAERGSASSKPAWNAHLTVFSFHHFCFFPVKKLFAERY